MRAIALQITPSPVAGHTRAVHCACGATRQAPVGLAIVSCVRCGAAMGDAADVVSRPPPSRALVALATFPTQLVGVLVFAIAIVWIAVLGVRDTEVVAALALGAACVFAGGNAYHGSVVALALCALLDAAIAIALLAPLADAVAFISPPLATLSDRHVELGRIIAGGIAAIAAAECLVAITQARQFGAWRHDQLRRATRITRS